MAMLATIQLLALSRLISSVESLFLRDVLTHWYVSAAMNVPAFPQ